MPVSLRVPAEPAKFTAAPSVLAPTVRSAPAADCWTRPIVPSDSSLNWLLMVSISVVCVAMVVCAVDSSVCVDASETLVVDSSLCVEASDALVVDRPALVASTAAFVALSWPKFTASESPVPAAMPVSLRSPAVPAKFTAAPSVLAPTVRSAPAVDC